jgi:hypothetical protein
MPCTSKWVKPEKLLTKKGVNVYCVYKNDDCENNPPYDYHFTLDVLGGDTENSFDVRELSTWKAPAHPPFTCGKDNTPKNRKAWDKYQDDGVLDTAVKTAIREAIVSGELKVPEDAENG